MPISVHRSNRVEVLAEALLAVVSQPLSTPFERETILVQSKGMERWLSMFLAQKLGVWANVAFPFPKACVAQLSGLFVPSVNSQAGVSPEGRVAEPFSRPALAWSIAAILPELLENPKFSELARYIQGDHALSRRLELSDKIAQIFDQYAVYRPELIRAFAKGEEDGWQAELWQKLLAVHGEGVAPTHVEELVQAMERARLAPAGLPERISVFGISSLPPIYLDVLRSLSKHCPVHLFQLSPSREYLGHVRSPKELARLQPSEADWQAQHFTLENPLLASLGRLGRDFQQVLESRVDYVESGSDLYVEPRKDTALGLLQHDILHLVHRAPRSDQAAPAPVDPKDTSITVHACHGPIREVEVLRDQLLARFEADPTLLPHDVIVMMPDVEAYAPILDAVFDREPGSLGHIPYRIADRSLRASSAAAEAFVAVVSLLSGRLKASEVLDLLGLPLVQSRLSLSGADLSQIRHWVFRSGIRWGENEAHRGELLQPEVPENTWELGLLRLLLGWAMPVQANSLFEGVLPVDGVEGSGAVVLGQLANFCQKLFEFRSNFQRPKTARQWQVAFGRLLDEVLGGEAALEADFVFVRETIGKLVNLAEKARFSEQLDLRTMELVLRRSFEDERTHHDFMTGGVTFCALLPMRSIPFRVVGLLGMNDGGFPRSTPKLAFDKIAQKPRLGDRSLSDEDRYLFLEAVLAARDALIITYVGRDPHDNKERPPSVVVGELLDTLNESFCVSQQAPQNGAERPQKATPVSEQFLLEHPLQAFSPRYFEHGRDARWFSYAEPEAKGARALAGSRADRPLFQVRPLPEVFEARLSVEKLASFFELPARAFLTGRLSLSLRDEPELVADREPIDPSALDRWGIGADLLERLLGGASLEDSLLLARAMGTLPLGTPGRCVYQRVADEAEQLARAALPWLSGERLEPQRFSLALSGCELDGAFTNLWPKAQVRRQFGRVKAKRELGVWIWHLALQCAEAGKLPRQSVLIGRGDAKSNMPKVCVFRPVRPERARAVLEDLVSLYRLGQQVPLPFFPDASKAYVTTYHKRAGQEHAASLALDAARDVFSGKGFGVDRADRGAAERDNLYVNCCFSAVEPISEELTPVLALAHAPGFVDLSTRIFEPLLEHLEGDNS
ncbi:MAG: exodeoxyribonuclease V subunit gamma [Polyangiaceae bacterium]|nr:exodeoxyribonuclease V subunit gamma [Polyangiaceae bacterium]